MSMDKEDGFERGFVAGWKARGEHEDGLLIEAELAKRQVEDGLDDLSLHLLRQQPTIKTTNHAWLSGSRIVTRNSDGGTTGWAEHDAVMLHHQLGVLLAELADARDEERKRSEAARVMQGEQQIAALKAETAKHGQPSAAQIGQQTSSQNAWPFCKNCGFAAMFCVCVPQQVNQQSWQGATARHDP